MSTEHISDELNYTPVVNNHSQVIFRKVSPQGSNTVTLSTSSSVGPVELIVPPSVFKCPTNRV
jgi:hypothetical protein